MSRVRRVGPKRPIERTLSSVFHLPVGTVTDSVLHTRDDRGTLIRMLVRLYAINIGSSTGLKQLGLVIQKAIGGTTITVPLLSESLDADERSTVLLRRLIPAHVHTATGVSKVIQIFEDIKAMRKMSKGDTIVLSDQAGAAAEWSLMGTVWMWFKE